MSCFGRGICLPLLIVQAARLPRYPGMALQAVVDYPEIDLGKSIMVGNNISDMLFGRNAGMKTVFLKTTSPDISIPNECIDLHFNNLDEFASALKKS